MPHQPVPQTAPLPPSQQVGPPLSRAGSNAPQGPTGLQRFAKQLGKAGVSLATGIPAIELDRRIAQNKNIEAQTIATQQDAEAERREAEKQARLQQLSRIAFGGGPQADAAMKEMFALDPESGEEAFNSIGAITQSQREEASRDAAAILAFPGDQRNQAILERAVNLEAAGRDASHTRELAELDPERQEIELRIRKNAPLTAAQRQTAAGTSASKLGQSVVTTDPEGKLSFATPVLTDDVVTTQQTPIGGTIVSRSAGETSAQRQLRDIETAGGETTARAVSTRDQNFIDVGQRQADGTAIIRRGIQLLETIKTGTPESIALAATNLLGITGADETELNANLGKAVLSQLRTTFGAQFTENEGKRLATLEAGFGKSTAGNRRLLEQTLRSMERDARRGIDAARRNEDQFSIDEIDKALKFDLDPNKDVSDDDRLKGLGL